jgi:uncharacterized membrane protein
MVGGAMALVEPAVNTVAYFFHERIWARLSRGDTEPTAGQAQLAC